jgi:hypothetical protein
MIKSQLITQREKSQAITTDGKNNQKVIGIASNGVIDFAGHIKGVSTLA